MAVTAEGRNANVLADMDRRVPTSFYWSLTLLATIGGFLFGYDTANIGSVLGFVPYKLGAFATGYLVAGASIGAAVGALAAGPLSDRFGRKSLLIADAAIYAVGAILSAVTWHVAVLLFARTLIGLAIGADSAIATAYIAEYAPSNRRGALSILQQWMITVGIFISYIVALVILLSMPGQAYNVDWRLILGLGAIPALLAFVLRTRMPESPRWLMLQGRYDDTRKALGMLGMNVSTEQIKASVGEVQAEERAAKPTRWSKGVKRALMVVVVFFIMQQITGINIPFYYGPNVMAPYLGASSKLAKAVGGVEVTTIMSLVNVIATYFAFRFIDRVGRRKLSIGGYIGMAVSILIAAYGVAFTGGLTRVIIVMVGLDLFIASFAIGVGGTGWLLQGEVFPTEVRGRAASIGAVADWLANFALILAFPTMQKSMGLAGVMVLFAALCIVAIVFIIAFLPETKQLSVEQITQIFERHAAGGTVSAGAGGRDGTGTLTA